MARARRPQDSLLVVNDSGIEVDATDSVLVDDDEADDDELSFDCTAAAAAAAAAASAAAAVACANSK